MNWFDKPYPLVSTLRDKLMVVLGFGLFTYFFLAIYQPFGAAEIQEYQHLFLFGFGISVSLGLAISYFLLPHFFPKTFHPDRWQIKKEIIFLLFSFLLISIFNYLYNSIIGANIAPQHSLIVFVGITFSVGIFPLLGLIFFTERFLANRNAKEAYELTKQAKEIFKEQLNDDQQIIIKAETQKTPDFKLSLDQFLFATSDNNYTTFFYLDENQKIQKRLLRISLKNTTRQLVPFEDIIRCHRSYIVNKKKITHISGNARSLNIHLENYEGIIPISRAFPREMFG